MAQKLVFSDSLPSLSGPRAAFDTRTSLIIYDKILLRLSKPFAAWVKKFPFAYAVESGEGLKSLDEFPKHVNALAKLARPLSPRTMTVVAVGGGSVGDFAGFFASIYKRGVRIEQVPSTWLAAIDSAHGGKTALNCSGAKNVVGTFHPASRVHLVKDLLQLQPPSRAEEGMGELAKIALIDGGPWVKQLERASGNHAEILWKFLKPAIESKMRVVEKDPTETKGLRQVLNLGHTVGHVLEAVHGLAHGKAVTQGLFFSLAFSEHKGYLDPATAARAGKLLTETLGLHPEIPRKGIPSSRFTELLLQDKKRDKAGQVTFVFLSKFGKPVRANVPVSEVVAEAKRMGWAAR